MLVKKKVNSNNEQSEIVVSFLRFLFGRPMLKTDLICPKCGGYISLKFDPGKDGKSGWVTKRCKCGTEIKYIKSGNEVLITKEQYDPVYKKWKNGGE